MPEPKGCTWEVLRTDQRVGCGLVGMGGGLVVGLSGLRGLFNPYDSMMLSAKVEEVREAAHTLP